MQALSAAKCTLVIYGETGSGKSSLLNFMMNRYAAMFNKPILDR